jgi:hypothetical protein
MKKIQNKKLCSRCKCEKEESQFYLVKSKNVTPYLQSICKKCNNIAASEWQRKNPERFKAQYRHRFTNDPEKIRKQKSVSECKRNQKLKRRVLNYYSNGTLNCDCCGETSFEFLCLDHINGGGSKHRREISGVKTIYQWVESNEYPIGFRVLCHNCNMSLGFYGYCPHQISRENTSLEQKEIIL